MSSPAGDSTDVPTTSTPTDPSFPIPSVAGAVAQEQQHDDRREPADDASAGREYKRARGDLALDPFNDPDGTRGPRTGERRGGAQGKQAKDIWSDLAMPAVAARPDRGSAGSQIRLYANLFPMRLSARDTRIYHYDVDFRIADLDKDIKWNKDDASRAWAAFAASQPNQAGAIRATAFDGLKNAYTPVQFTFPPDADGKEVHEGNFAVEFQLGNRTKRWVIALGLVNTIDMQKLLDYASDVDSGAPNVRQKAIEAAKAVPSSIQALDILLRAHVGQNFKITSGQGRKWFKAGFQSSPLPVGAEVLQGLFQSVRPTSLGPALQLDTAYSAFIKGGKLMDVVLALSPSLGGGRGGSGGGGRGGYGGGRGGYMGGNGGHNIQPDWRRMKRYLKSARVTFTHREVAVPLTIFGFTRLGANEETFELKPRRKRGEPEPAEGEGPPPRTLSIAQYYAENYNINLQRPDWPCVDLKEKRMRVPVELCVLLPGQPVPFAMMLPEQTAQMIRVAGKAPPERFREIKATRQVASYVSPMFDAWQVEIQSQPAQALGRMLPPPRIQYAPSSRELSPRVNAGTWNNLGSQFKRPGIPLDSWGWISFDRNFNSDRIKQFATAFIRVLRDCGMVVNNERPVVHEGSHDLLRSLKETGKKCVEQSGRPPQLLCILVPDRMTYEPLKRHLASDLPALVPSQFMMTPTIGRQSDSRKLNQYQMNVAMKVNLKLGGSNWSLSPADLPPRTMILGCDVTHPNPGSKSASMAAVCGTTDATASDYKVEIRLQDQRVEVVQRMDEMVRALLENWKANPVNGGKGPDKIVCYRDGISDGEFHQVVETEIAAIRQASQEFSPGQPIPITYVSAGKRHHMRFFCSQEDSRFADRKGNLPPGTVVDAKGVTQPLIFDFYLQAHAGLQGTARPTHYTVLADQNGFSSDEIQRLTNSLSFVFGRATRSVSLVSAAYFADVCLEKCRVLAATEFDDASTTVSGHSGDRDAPAAMLDPDFFSKKLSRADGFHPMWFM